MTAWPWMFAPQLHFPFSGNLKQHIEPRTDWFKDNIRPGTKAGDADVEREAFHIASYGQQLGWLTEVLLHSIDGQTLTPQQAAKSLEHLRDTRRQIEDVKKRPGRPDLGQQLRQLRQDDPDAFLLLQQEFLVAPAF